MSKNNHTLHVRAKSDRGFWRGGIRFHREATELRAADLTPDQLAAIRAEHGRGLIVVEAGAEEQKGAALEILVGTDKLPSHVLIAEGVEAPLGDVVAIGFAAATGNPALGVTSVDDWNAEAFGEQRDALLLEVVEHLKADPQIYQAFLDERAKSATKPGKASTAKGSKK